MDVPPELPFLTPAQAGCGGFLKRTPEDFFVEEIPAYPPSGDGEHLLLLVEKRGITTSDLVGRASKMLGLRPSQVGYAGLKDAQAVTRQWISLHTKEEPRLARLESPEIKVLRVERHRNKLRRGHLRGNRFRIVLRESTPPAGFTLLWKTLAEVGFPNYFGPQRFGAEGDNARKGALIVSRQIRPPANRDHARLLINAFQSALFNRLVAHRISERARLDDLLPGDFAIFRESGSFFAVTEAGLDDACRRAAGGEISAAAPLFGYKTPLAEGLPGEWERSALESNALDPADFRLGGKKLSQAGTRRAVRAFPENHSWRAMELEGRPCLELEFSLRQGVYATSFLRELMKSEGPYPNRRATPVTTPEDRDSAGGAHAAHPA